MGVHEAVFLQMKQALLGSGGENLDTWSMRLLVKQVKELTYPLLASYDELERELYVAHLLALALEKCNREVLHLDYREFRQGVYFPHLLYIVVRLLPTAGRFLHRTIRKVFQECVRKYTWISGSSLNAELVHSDAFYDFLGNGLKKINPLSLVNLPAFYQTFFRNVLSYHFLRNRGGQRIVRRMVPSDQQPSVRFRMYHRILSKMETELFAMESPTLMQVLYNLRIFENIIKNNELQRLFFLAREKRIGGDEIRHTLAVHRESMKSSSPLMEKIKSLDIVYQLLRCCRVSSKKGCNGHAVTAAMVKTVVFEELVLNFKNLISERFIYEIFEQIAVNFAETVLGGEYINPLTFSTVKINSLSFVSQIRAFLNLCLNFISVSNRDGFYGQICTYPERFSGKGKGDNGSDKQVGVATAGGSEAYCRDRAGCELPAPEHWSGEGQCAEGQALRDFEPQASNIGSVL